MEIAKCLRYEFHAKGREVFEYGSIGEKFYMILGHDGEVSVQIPNPECRDFRRRFEELMGERKWQADMQT